MSGYTCRCCGQTHPEMPTSFAAPAPLYVNDVAEEERAARVELASDQCVIDGEHFFILGNLDIPIVGHPESLRWTVWTSLSQKNFDRASELWTKPGREQEPPYFGWLSNWIPVYEESTLNLKTLVHTQPVGLRPKIEVLECDHVLSREQRDGISLDRAEVLIHRALHG
jgi:hypothetical protein